MNLEEKSRLARIAANLWGSKKRQTKTQTITDNSKSTLATDIRFKRVKTEDKQPDILAKDFMGRVKGVEQIYK